MVMVGANNLTSSDHKVLVVDIVNTATGFFSFIILNSLHCLMKC